MLDNCILICSECIEKMVSRMLTSSEISPSLRAIVNQLDSDDQRQSESFSSGQVNGSPDMDDDVSADTFGDHGAWDFDHDDQECVVDDNTHNQDMMFPSQHEVPYLVDISLIQTSYPTFPCTNLPE